VACALSVVKSASDLRSEAVDLGPVH
jgi:hypothetical protein